MYTAHPLSFCSYRGGDRAQHAPPRVSPGVEWLLSETDPTPSPSARPHESAPPKIHYSPQTHTSAHTRCPITANRHPRPSTSNRTQRDERRHPSACAAAGGCSGWGRTQELLSPGQRDREDVQPREKAELRLAMLRAPAWPQRPRTALPTPNPRRTLCRRVAKYGDGPRATLGPNHWPLGAVGAWANTRFFEHPRRRPAFRAS